MMKQENPLLFHNLLHSLISEDFFPYFHSHQIVKKRASLCIVLVFYCCLSNSHKCSSLEEYAFMSARFCRSVYTASLDFLLRVSQRWNRHIGLVAFLSEDQDPSSRLLVVWRVYFLEVGGPASLFLCRLLAGEPLLPRDLPQLLAMSPPAP